MNARFYERQGICILFPLLPRTIKANRILDDPCRYPAFNLYTTSGVVLQRRGINGARTPVSSSAEQKCIVIFPISRCATTRPVSPSTEEKREFGNNRNWRGYPRVLPPRFNSCTNVADLRAAHWRGSRR